MKKKLLILLTVATFLLVACEEEETVMKELIFLEKTTDYVEPSFIFESPTDKKYYLVEVSNWEYDNSTYKKDDIVKLESIKSKSLGPIESLFFYSLVPDGVVLTEEDVFIYDDWASLYALSDYTKSEK